MMGDFVFMAVVQAGVITLQHAGEKKKIIQDTQSSAVAKSAMMGFFHFPWRCKEKAPALAIRCTQAEGERVCDM